MAERTATAVVCFHAFLFYFHPSLNVAALTILAGCILLMSALFRGRLGRTRAVQARMGGLALIFVAQFIVFTIYATARPTGPDILLFAVMLTWFALSVREAASIEG